MADPEDLAREREWIQEGREGTRCQKQAAGGYLLQQEVLPRVQIRKVSGESICPVGTGDNSRWQKVAGVSSVEDRLIA
jgi:hypothetical protein